MDNLPSLDELFARCRQILVFDTETTGLDPEKDEITQFCGFLIRQQSGVPTVARVYNELIRLPAGRHVPEYITQLTGITDYDLNTRGLSRSRVCRDIAELIHGRTLLVAYNAHFDLSFLFHLLARSGDPAILQGKDKLDLLTVYRDRRPGPHGLCNAIAAYGLEGDCNSHRAEEDALAAYHLMLAMAREKDDLHLYRNLFGYSPKYGCPRRPIRSAVYCRQSGLIGRPIYEGLESPPAAAPIRRGFTVGDLTEMFRADAENAQRPLDLHFTREE